MVLWFLCGHKAKLLRKILCWLFLWLISLGSKISFCFSMVLRKSRKLVGNGKSLQNSPVKAVYSGEAWAPERNSQLGIWSIRSLLSAYLCTIMKFVCFRKSPNKLLYCRFLFWLMDKLQIWYFRDDLQVPSSPYFPAYAQGQGPPPVVQERFQSVISQLFQHVGD